MRTFTRARILAILHEHERRSGYWDRHYHRGYEMLGDEEGGQAGIRHRLHRPAPTARRSALSIENDINGMK